MYSHLANADDLTSGFIHEQIEQFERSTAFLDQHINYSFDRHILNSEGVLNYPEYHFDMVRLGIGMYGYCSSENHVSQLSAAIKWFSSVSQIKKVDAGKTVGYNRQGRTSASTNIAIIPVGYADGFRRSLSNGKGGV